MGYLLVAVAAALWGLLGPVTTLVLREGVGATEIAFWRAVLGAALFGAHAVAIRRVRTARRHVPAVAGFGVFGVAGLLACFSWAVEAGGAALAAVLLYTAPVWVALLSWTLLRERMTPAKLSALAIATIGVAGIATSGGGTVRVSGAGIAWGLSAGFAYALFYLFGKRFFGVYPTATLFLWALPAGALTMLPLVRFAPKGAVAWGGLAFIALVPTWLAYVCYAAGLRRVEATRASVVATVEPVVAAVGAYLLWGERMTVTGYLFAVVVLAGVLLMVRGDTALATGEARPV
jgi:drug/metabolite transporter, DME family